MASTERSLTAAFVALAAAAPSFRAVAGGEGLWVSDVPERLLRRRAERRRQLRRRRQTALAAVLGVVVLLGVGFGLGGGDDQESGGEAKAESEGATLPGGGRRILPDHRVVAFYGAPQSEELGVLGIGEPDRMARRLERQARPYSTKARPALGAFELIAVVAADAPGEGDLYRTRQDDAIVSRYLQAARRVGAILLLDIQPGRSDFLTEAKALEKWLREPDVGLALDPEWRMEASEVPGQTIGSVDASEVNATSAWLSELARREDLPQKLLVIHRFTDGMIENLPALEDPPGIATVINVDGFGTEAQKVAKYQDLEPHSFRAGFKLFYEEDTGLMTPQRVLRLRPQPDLIVYE